MLQQKQPWTFQQVDMCEFYLKKMCSNRYTCDILLEKKMCSSVYACDDVLEKTCSNDYVFEL